MFGVAVGGPSAASLEDKEAFRAAGGLVYFTCEPGGESARGPRVKGC